MNKPLEILKVGQKYPEWRTRQDTFIMDYDESGFTLYAMMNELSDHEKAQFKQNGEFALRYCIIDEICMFCFKFGDMPWSDCPFSPALYKTIGNKINFPKITENEGFSLTVLLIDTSTGELCNIRLIGIGHDISCDLHDWFLDAMNNDLYKGEYDMRVNNIYNSYSTDDLVRKGSKNEFLICKS